MKENEDVSDVKHHAFITIGLVDGAVVHKQAYSRLTDFRTKGEKTIVHAHSKPRHGGSLCTAECMIYHECATDDQPRGHSIAMECPEPEEDDEE